MQKDRASKWYIFVSIVLQQGMKAMMSLQDDKQQLTDMVEQTHSTRYYFRTREHEE
jgi:hypothetical protein